MQKCISLKGLCVWSYHIKSDIWFDHVFWIEEIITEACLTSQALSQLRNTRHCSTRSRKHPCLSAQLSAAEGRRRQGQKMAAWSWSTPGKTYSTLQPCWIISAFDTRWYEAWITNSWVLAARGTYSCAGQSLWAGSQSRGHPSKARPAESAGGPCQWCSGLEGERSKDIPTEKLPLLSSWGKSWRLAWVLISHVPVGTSINNRNVCLLCLFRSFVQDVT